MPMRWWLVVPFAVVLPWASLAAAWVLSGQWWLGLAACIAGGYLAVQILFTTDRWLSSRGM